MIPHLVFFATVAGIQAAYVDTKYSYPCPPKEQIAPCTCTDTSTTMDMHCSYVESEAQLMDIFHSTPPFPVNHFTKFIMHNNKNVKILDNRVFGSCTFDEIEVRDGALKEMEQDSILESNATLRKLDLSGNQMERFLANDQPDLTMFTALERLDLSRNQIGVFPSIKSNTLQWLYMNDNPINRIHNEHLLGVPNLEVIDISDINLYILESRLFSNHRKLEYIYLNNNNLIQIDATQLTTQSPELKKIELRDNQIDDVEPSAFDMNAGSLHLDFNGNQLVTLDEWTWKPLIEAGVFIDVSENPLDCGCDMKWAIAPANDDFDYISAMEGTCPWNDNVPFEDLDPDWYNIFCK